jgi:cell shape-determining protein MreD
MFFALLILLAIALLLEGTITTLPLVLVCILCLGIFRRDALTFFIAFFAGFLLDALLLHPVGKTSLFFVTFLFLVSLYQRKYEINSVPFVLAASFIGSVIFLWIFGDRNILLQSVLSSVIATVLFSVCRNFSKLERRPPIVPTKIGIYK